jgi:hypothetical protein
MRVIGVVLLVYKCCAPLGIDREVAISPRCWDLNLLVKFYCVIFFTRVV